MSAQSTRHIMMVEPVGFYANPQTMESNNFQEPSDRQGDGLSQEAVEEFRKFRDKLIYHGVFITTVAGNPECPDDVFVNNWVSTHADRTMVLYPLRAPNRRLERREDVVGLLSRTYDLRLDMTDYEAQERALESTGVLILDRMHKVAYCALSNRAERSLLDEWGEKMGYKVIGFQARDHTGATLYHTNIMMFIGSGYVGVCLDCIVDDDRGRVLSELEKHHEVVDISIPQMQSMCGNALEVLGANDSKILAMSSAAYQAYTDDQKSMFLKHVGNIVHSDLSTIEQNGGGSARCMLLELY